KGCACGRPSTTVPRCSLRWRDGRFWRASSISLLSRDVAAPSSPPVTGASKSNRHSVLGTGTFPFAIRASRGPSVRPGPFGRPCSAVACTATLRRHRVSTSGRQNLTPRPRLFLQRHTGRHESCPLFPVLRHASPHLGTANEEPTP